MKCGSIATSLFVAIALSSAASFSGLDGQTHPEDLPEVVEQGDGDFTLLLLPCMSCRWRSFDGFMDRNESRFSMISVTVPGFGGTTPPPLPMYSGNAVWHRNALAALEALVEEKDPEKLVIVGHSWGGSLGTELAARLGDRVVGMVFIDAWPTSDRGWFADDEDERAYRAARVRIDQANLRTDLDAWQAFNGVSAAMPVERQLQYHGWFMATPVDVVLQYWSENNLVDLNPMLASIEAPMLDIKAVPTGATPETYRAGRADHWASNCPSCEVTTILVAESGHFIHETKPEAVDLAISEFLQMIASGSDL